VGVGWSVCGCRLECVRVSRDECKAWDSQTVRTVRLEWNCPQAFFMELDWTAHDPELLTTTCLSEPILYLYLNTSPISCVLL